MADLALDLDKTSPNYYDYLLIDGDLALTSDAQAGGTDPVLQDILQQMRSYFGEWFMDNTFGMPWFQQILIKNPNQANIDALMVNKILSIPGVQGLNDYQFTPNFKARGLDVSFIAQKAQGTVDYSGTVSPTNTTTSSSTATTTT